MAACGWRLHRCCYLIVMLYCFYGIAPMPSSSLLDFSSSTTAASPHTDVQSHCCSLPSSLHWGAQAHLLSLLCSVLLLFLLSGSLSFVPFPQLSLDFHFYSFIPLRFLLILPPLWNGIRFNIVVYFSQQVCYGKMPVDLTIICVSLQWGPLYIRWLW